MTASPTDRSGSAPSIAAAAAFTRTTPPCRTSTTPSASWSSQASAATLGKPVPPAAHGLDQVVAQALAKLRDVLIDGAFRAQETLAPDAVEELGAREHAPGVGGEVGDQLELAAGELHFAPVARDAPPFDVHDQSAHRGTAPGRHATQQRPEPGDELGRAERLDQVVVGARLEPADAVHLAGAGGQHQHRQPCVLGVRPEPA